MGRYAAVIELYNLEISGMILPVDDVFQRDNCCYSEDAVQTENGVSPIGCEDLHGHTRSAGVDADI